MPKRARPLPTRGLRVSARYGGSFRSGIHWSAEPSRSSRQVVSPGTASLTLAKKLLVDLTVTQTGLDKAIAFANELFLALETRDHRLVIAPNSDRFNMAKVDELGNSGKVIRPSCLETT